MSFFMKSTWSDMARLSLAVLATVLLLEATMVRNAIYRDQETLWSDAVLRSPRKARPHYNLGNTFKELGRMEQAIIEWRRAVAIDPRYSKAYNQLGNIYYLSGSLIEAERYYALAVASEPGNAEAQYNLAQVSEILGRDREAIAHYERFLQIAQTQPDAAVERARARLQVLRKQ